MNRQSATASRRNTVTAPGIATVLCIAFICFPAAASTDLVLRKDDNEDPTRVGHNLVYSLCVSNSGPGEATNVIVSDILPAGTGFLDCQVSQGTWTQREGILTCYLGTIAPGGTAVVEVTVSVTEAGTLTNTASITGDDYPDNNRDTELTEVLPPNRSPVIDLPGPHTLTVGATTTFVVSVSDPDHDPDVSLTSTIAPAGASFDGTNFTWTAGVKDVGTTNIIEFVADDHQGETNSVVTNRTWIIVPRDHDGDTLGDDWEWRHFGDYGQNADDDPDGDGMINYDEYLAGTQPTNMASRFSIDELVDSGNQHRITVQTYSGRCYTIFYRDSMSGPWSSFILMTNGVGYWIETNRHGSFTFVDDEGPQTSGGPPPAGRRYYRIRVEIAP